MTAEYVIAGNKLIIESDFVPKEHTLWLLKAIQYRTEDQLFGTLKYHSDWNWLMQVVDKIEEKIVRYRGSVIPGGLPALSILGKKVHIGDSQFCHVSVSVCEPKASRLQNLYMAVVAFIEWYNKNKSDVKDKEETKAS